MVEYIICVFMGNLIKVPFDNEMSGYYVRYDEAMTIKENCDLPDEYGLLVEYNSYTLVEDSWDGFQPVFIEKKEEMEAMINLLSESIGGNNNEE